MTEFPLTSDEVRWDPKDFQWDDNFLSDFFKIDGGIAEWLISPFVPIDQGENDFTKADLAAPTTFVLPCAPQPKPFAASTLNSQPHGDSHIQDVQRAELGASHSHPYQSPEAASGVARPVYDIYGQDGRGDSIFQSQSPKPKTRRVDAQTWELYLPKIFELFTTHKEVQILNELAKFGFNPR